MTEIKPSPVHPRAMTTDDEVEMAMRAARSGNAGHWPMVAAVLHDEVERRGQMIEGLSAKVHRLADGVELLRAQRSAVLARCDELDAKDRGMTWIDVAEVRALLDGAA